MSKVFGLRNTATGQVEQAIEAPKKDAQELADTLTAQAGLHLGERVSFELVPLEEMPPDPEELERRQAEVQEMSKAELKELEAQAKEAASLEQRIAALEARIGKGG